MLSRNFSNFEVLQAKWYWVNFKTYCNGKKEMCKFLMLALEFVQHLVYFFVVICTTSDKCRQSWYCSYAASFVFTLQNFANSHEQTHFWQRTEENTKTVQMLHNIEYPHPNACRCRSLYASLANLQVLEYSRSFNKKATTTDISSVRHAVRA